MLNYTRSGRGKETLVLLHGFMENNTIWNEMEPFLESKFTLIKIDLPGHGKSPNISNINSMKLMAEEVKKVIDKEKIHKLHLLGHSMGGYVALAYAEKFGEDLKSITLFFSTFLQDSDERKELRRKSFRIIKENIKSYVSAGVPILFNPYEREKLASKISLAKEIACSTSAENVIATLEGIMIRPNRFSVINDFSGKILFILGKHDAAIDSLHILKEVPQIENIKTYLLDCGHNGHWEKPQICSSIIVSELY